MGRDDEILHTRIYTFALDIVTLGWTYGRWNLIQLLHRITFKKSWNYTKATQKKDWNINIVIMLLHMSCGCVFISLSHRPSYTFKKKSKKRTNTDTWIAWNARLKEHFLVSSVQFCCFAELVWNFSVEKEEKKVRFKVKIAIWITSECEISNVRWFAKSYRSNVKTNLLQ